MKAFDPDNFVSWLLHSDWYLIGGWLFVLAIAVLVTFAEAPTVLFRSRSSQVDDISPES